MFIFKVSANDNDKMDNRIVEKHFDVSEDDQNMVCDF